MINKRILFLTTALILLTLSACMPQTELEPAPLATLAPPELVEGPLATLAPPELVEGPLATPAPPELVEGPLATLPSTEELIMPVEPTDTPPASSEEKPIDPFSTEKQPEPDLQPAIMGWVDEAKQDLAQRQSISTEQIELLSFEPQVWPNAGMGCPQPGMMYAQVMVEGYLIRLVAGDEIYNYHGGGNRAPFLCEQSGPGIAITKQAPKLDIKLTPTKSVPPPRD